MKKIKFIGLLLCVGYLFSCERQEEIQKFETYFDNPEFITDGLIAYYPFNGTVNDSSGNNLNGIATNVTYSTDRFGNLNGACKLSGTDSYVTVRNNHLLNTGSYTICFWYRADTLNDGTLRAILSKTDTLEGYVVSTIRNDNYSTNLFEKTMYYKGVEAYSGSMVLGSSSNHWIQNEQEKFVFTAISFNDSTFFDHNYGQLTRETFNVPVSFIAYKFDLLIGKSNLPHLSSAKGEIDDLLIYNRFLTSDEAIKLSAWNK
ncbi:MAG: LamG-like jellyroll fold domain-containing protein [Salinivirgaceae bacterium]